MDGRLRRYVSVHLPFAGEGEIVDPVHVEVTSEAP
jgi:hypothetical protein